VFNDLSKFKLDSKDNLKLAVFVCSSTGDGESPENGFKFFRFLRQETNKLGAGGSSNLLSHVFYTVLGLGDSNYSKF